VYKVAKSHLNWRIVSINGKTISSFHELRAKIGTLGAGKKVTLGIIRDGKEKSVKVTLGEQENVKASADKLHQGLTGAALTNTNASDSVQGVKDVR